MMYHSMGLRLGLKSAILIYHQEIVTFTPALSFDADISSLLNKEPSALWNVHCLTIPVYEDGMDNRISMLRKGQALGFKSAIVTKEYSLCTTVYRKITVAIARA